MHACLGGKLINAGVFDILSLYEIVSGDRVRGRADANLGSIGSLGGIAERDESSERGSVAESSFSDGIDSPSPIAGIESIIDNELDGAVLAGDGGSSNTAGSLLG